MVWIYSDKINYRLNYVLQFIFAERGVHFKLTNNKIEFLSAKGIKLAYSKNNFDANIAQIMPAELLFENKIVAQSLSKSPWKSCDCLQFENIIDPIASVFYVLTRYEEYLPFEADSHGRFTSKNSILSQFSWLIEPICDIWSEAIINDLSRFYSTQIDIQKPFNFIPTFDIDNTFAFSHKSKIQLYGGWLKDLLQRNKEKIKTRKMVLFNKEKDPFDTFNQIQHLKKQGLDVKIFWHLGDLKKYDRNISWKNKTHQKLIQQMSETFEIGIHPSYYSNENHSKIEEEKGRLEKIIAKKITLSRQHFLKLQFPFTYQNLLKAGITNDYSMGFSDEVGFRMGTARSTLFFDLSKNKPTKLMINPFVYMDGTLNQYKKMSPEKAKQSIEQLFLQVKKYGGNFIFIWHNETIGETGIWKNWKNVFEHTISLYTK